MINRDSEIEILSTNELGSWNANILCVIEVLKTGLNSGDLHSQNCFHCAVHYG